MPPPVIGVNYKIRPEIMFECISNDRVCSVGPKHPQARGAREKTLLHFYVSAWEPLRSLRSFGINMLRCSMLSMHYVGLDVLWLTGLPTS
jgi:hypothetical protein